jgi:sporulation protein YlmC with PRC-barrel domain
MAADEKGQTPRRPTCESERFTIGSTVIGTDGKCGELVRAIVDPDAQALTHLVVQPVQRHALGRLVPIALVEAVDGDLVRLSCTTVRFHALDDAEDIEFVVPEGEASAYGSNAMSPGAYGYKPIGAKGPKLRTSDRVPVGEVEVQRGDQVLASDGWIGAVQGFVIDPADNRVTHVLLQEGHLWGRKQVAIPIGATSRVGEEIRVGLTTQQVKDLPPVEFGSDT